MNVRSLILGLLVAVTSATANGGLVVIHDQTFTDGTWQASVQGGTNITGASVSRQVATGVTGDRLITTMSHNGKFTFEVFDEKLNRPWVPAVDGEILSIDWQVWYLAQDSNQSRGMYLAARQGNSIYVGPRFQPQIFLPQWQKASNPNGPETPGSMLRRYGGGPLSMQFEVNSPPIYFGFLQIREGFLSGASFSNSFFDLQITSRPIVPELNSFVLLTLAIPFSVIARCIPRRGRN